MGSYNGVSNPNMTDDELKEFYEGIQEMLAKSGHTPEPSSTLWSPSMPMDITATDYSMLNDLSGMLESIDYQPSPTNKTASLDSDDPLYRQKRYLLANDFDISGLSDEGIIELYKISKARESLLSAGINEAYLNDTSLLIKARRLLDSGATLKHIETFLSNPSIFNDSGSDLDPKYMWDPNGYGVVENPWYDPSEDIIQQPFPETAPPENYRWEYNTNTGDWYPVYDPSIETQLPEMQPYPSINAQSGYQWTQNPSTGQWYQQPIVNYEPTPFELEQWDYQKTLDAQNRADELASQLWQQNWAMAQSPSSPQPSGFAGWGYDYDWSPSAHMDTGQGWITSPMSMEEMNNPYVYGSSAWAQAGSNWWDTSRINRTLEQAGTPELMQYTSLVPSVVAQYFQGIEPYMSARSIESGMQGDPYQLSSIPSWGAIQGWTPTQYQQMESAFSNLHTPYDWEELLRTSYAQSPPGSGTSTALNYYR